MTIFKDVPKSFSTQRRPLTPIQQSTYAFLCQPESTRTFEIKLYRQKIAQKNVKYEVFWIDKECQNFALFLQSIPERKPHWNMVQHLTVKQLNAFTTHSLGSQTPKAKQATCKIHSASRVCVHVRDIISLDQKKQSYCLPPKTLTLKSCCPVSPNSPNKHQLLRENTKRGKQAQGLANGFEWSL